MAPESASHNRDSSYRRCGRQDNPGGDRPFGFRAGGGKWPLVYAVRGSSARRFGQSYTLPSVYPLGYIAQSGGIWSVYPPVAYGTRRLSWRPARCPRRLGS
eukprot:scaffold108179_cov66-Phaeocystis_antarctica.AAC.1